MQVIDAGKVQAVSKRIRERVVPQQPFGFIHLCRRLCFILLNLLALKRLLELSGMTPTSWTSCYTYTMSNDRNKIAHCIFTINAIIETLSVHRWG